jgi:hypothetical protein
LAPDSSLRRLRLDRDEQTITIQASFAPVEGLFCRPDPIGTACSAAPKPAVGVIVNVLSRHTTDDRGNRRR